MRDTIPLVIFLTVLTIFAGIGVMFLFELIKNAVNSKLDKNRIVIDPESIDVLDPAVLVQAECSPRQAEARKETWKKINKSIKDGFSNGGTSVISSDIYGGIPYELLITTLENAGYTVTDVTGERFAKSCYDGGYRIFLRIKEVG